MKCNLLKLLLPIATTRAFWCREAILGPWSCWSEREWNCWQAHKEWFWSAVYWAWALFRDFLAEHKNDDEMLDEESTSGIVARSL